MAKTSHGYADLHVHTKLSDGFYTQEELLKKAAEVSIRYLAFTDHDRLSKPGELEALHAARMGITLIPGTEISATYTAKSSGKEIQIHILVLFYTPGHAPALEAAAALNRSFDRREHVDMILQKLRPYGIDAGSYDELQERYTGVTHVGRMCIAKEMLRRGYVSSIDEAFEEYLGEHGKQRAYCPTPFHYCDMERVIQAAIADRAIPILAHPYYYASLTDAEREELVQTFRQEAGAHPAGLEALYGIYTEEQRAALRAMADRHGLYLSAGSDYHNDEDQLDQRFPAEICEALMRVHQALVGGEK